MRVSGNHEREWAVADAALAAYIGGLAARLGVDAVDTEKVSAEDFERIAFDGARVMDAAAAAFRRLNPRY